MSSERKSAAGSFRDHIDELLTRLSHERLVGAGMARSGESDEKTPNAGRGRDCPAFMLNEALFERAQRSGRR